MTQTIEMPTRRGPRIGDAVVYIRQIDGKYHQHPGLVYEVVGGSLSPYPSIRIAAFIPNTHIPNYTDMVQHRDHWAEGGGDDFERYWCWPEEAEVHARYATPVVTGRPAPPDITKLGTATPYGADFLQATSATLGVEAPEPTVAVVGRELDRVARLGGQQAQEELDLVAGLSTRMLARLEANRHRGGWGDISLVELCTRVDNRTESLVDGTRNYLWELDHGVGSDPRRVSEDARCLDVLRDAAADSACYIAMVMQKIDSIVARRSERSAPEPLTPTGVLGVAADKVIVDDLHLSSDPSPDRWSDLVKWSTDIIPGHEEIRRGELTETLEELDKCEKEKSKLGTAQERCRMLVEQLVELRAPARDMINVLEDLSSAEAQSGGVDKQIGELRQRLRGLVPSLSGTSFAGLDNPSLTRRLVELEAMLCESNELLRSLASVVGRAGRQTNWDPLAARLSQVLQRQHELMYPEQYEVGPAVGPADPHASPLADEGSAPTVSLSGGGF